MNSMYSNPSLSVISGDMVSGMQGWTIFTWGNISSGKIYRRGVSLSMCMCLQNCYIYCQGALHRCLQLTQRVIESFSSYSFQHDYLSMLGNKALSFVFFFLFINQLKCSLLVKLREYWRRTQSWKIVLK